MSNAFTTIEHGAPHVRHDLKPTSKVSRLGMRSALLAAPQVLVSRLGLQQTVSGTVTINPSPRNYVRKR